VTDQTVTPQVPTQGGPPLADTRDMAQVHKVFREAIASAPQFIGSALARGNDRVELVASYYDNVLHMLKVHHEGEDELIWDKLCQRAPAQADEVRRIASQHNGVTEALGAAFQRIAEWRGAPTDESTTATAVAIAVLGAALLPHLDEEEAYIVPLAAQHIYAPEWGELPGHAMQHFGGDKIWLVMGLVREQMRPDQIAMMEAHMPPPALEMWQNVGQHAFPEFTGALRSDA
jgi:hypothetical protein